MINLIKVDINEATKKAVCDVLDSGILAQGKQVEEFEKEFAKFNGSKYAIATNSGTSALHTALLALGIKEGDEVITTPFTFIATANAIRMCGAEPVFCDISSVTYNIDVKKIEALITPRTKAIVPVHLYGCPANMPRIMEIAERYNLLVVEDACQAVGATLHGQYVGTFGDAGCFSFYPTKNMTTGEGGMIITDREDIDKLSRVVREHGTIRGEYNYTRMGFNYRMTNIAGAIGLEQLKTLKAKTIERQAIAETYKKMINHKDIVLPRRLNDSEPCWNLFTLRIINGKKDEFINYLKEKGIQSETYYRIPVHLQLYYCNSLLNGTDCLTSELMSRELVSIPVRPNLTIEEITHIVNTINLWD